MTQSTLLLAVACLVSTIKTSAFVSPPWRPAASQLSLAPLRNTNPKKANDALGSETSPDVGEKGGDGVDSGREAVAAASAVAGISGLGAAASTVVTTAGGVCAGGACAAGGAAAAAGGGTVSAAAAGGGLLAGAKALLAGGALAASVLLGGGSPPPTLEAMVRASTPLEVAIGNGRPTVVEFYGNACPHCHEAARRLLTVEDAATHQRGFNWVMVDTDDPGTAPLWRSYRVDELPHFEFLDAEGREVGVEVGEVDSRRIEDRVEQLAARGPYAIGSLSTASTSSQ